MNRSVELCSIDGATPDGTVPGGPCAINCTNQWEVFSLHTGGANCLFADGSVRYLTYAIGTDDALMQALGTRAGGEAVTLP